MDEKKFTITDQHQKVYAFNEIQDLPETGNYEVVIKKVCKSRTNRQNAALHLYLKQMALTMEDAGITNRTLFSALKDGFEIPPSMTTVKEIVNKVSVERYGRTTSKLSTVEIQELYEICNSAFAQSVGISLNWPSDDPPPY